MGWGYMRLCCHLVGSQSLIEEHINFLELKAVWFVLKPFVDHLHTSVY